MLENGMRYMSGSDVPFNWGSGAQESFSVGVAQARSTRIQSTVILIMYIFKHQLSI